MRSENVNYVVVGLFVIAMAAAALVSLALLSGRGGATDTYVADFDNVADVKFGTQVRYDGYPVGQVEGITPVADGPTMRFRVEMSVKKGWRIPEDSVARIGSSTILGARTIDIRGGAATRTLAPGGRIASVPSRDLVTAITTVAEDVSELNREALRPLIDKLAALVGSVGGDLQSISRRLDESLKTVQRILSPANAEAVARTVANMESASRRLDASLAAVQGVLSPANVDAARTMVLNAESATRDLAAAGREAREAVEGVGRLVARIDAVVGENRETIDGAVRDAGYVLRSLADNIDTLNHNLQGASRNLNEFSRLIRQNPGLLLGGRPRQKEAEADGTVQSGSIR